MFLKKVVRDSEGKMPEKMKMTLQTEKNLVNVKQCYGVYSKEKISKHDFLVFLICNVCDFDSDQVLKKFAQI